MRTDTIYYKGQRLVKGILPLFLLAFLPLLVACGHKVPENFWEKDELPSIYPDYTDVTVPVNIAPLTFQIDGKADDVVARLTAGDVEIVCGGH